MRSALAAAIVLILVAASLGAGYGIGNATSHTKTTTSTALSTSTFTEVSTATTTVTSTSSASAPWTVIEQNGTFTGPGCPPSTESAKVLAALRIPCLNQANSTTWYASLLSYDGKDFYASNDTVISTSTGSSTTYTVWFDNSTAWCVSPYFSISELPSCPPP